jgi:hypothetical protein
MDGGENSGILGTFLDPGHPQNGVPRRRMNRMPRQSGLYPNLLLAALLLCGQFGSLAHAYEHDPGAPQGKVCPTCVTASQLSAASVDTHTPDPIAPAASQVRPEQHSEPASATAIHLRARGPPAPL